jgi:hypothetical protein
VNLWFLCLFTVGVAWRSICAKTPRVAVANLIWEWRIRFGAWESLMGTVAPRREKGGSHAEEWWVSKGTPPVEAAENVV